MSYSDVLDHSASISREYVERAVVEIQKNVNYDITGTGVCELCQAPVEPIWIEDHTRQIVGRWCSVECRDRVDL